MGAHQVTFGGADLAALPVTSCPPQSPPPSQRNLARASAYPSLEAPQGWQAWQPHVGTSPASIAAIQAASIAAIQPSAVYPTTPRDAAVYPATPRDGPHGVAFKPVP